MIRIVFYSLLVLIQLSVLNASAQTVTLTGTGSVWKYLDNGSNQGTAWRSSSFNDASWLSGASQLGYGDGDEAKIVSYGPSSSSKYITTYFRRAISISDVNTLSNFVMRVKRDDGIVVYFNGVERYRNNMPTGTISNTTAASATASDDGNTWISTNLLASYFVTGTNSIAVEIHQRNGSSSDISFDMELTATSIAADVTAPVLSSVNPLDNSTNVSITSNLVMTFNENIQKGTGLISIKEAGVAIQTIDVLAAAVTISGNTLTINPSDFGFTKALTIEMPSGVVKDLAGNNFAGITTATTWNFTTQSSVAPSTIGTFTSVLPTAQTAYLVLPSTHTFQYLFKQGSSYSTGGTVPGGNDFTGYIPTGGSSTSGYLHINHENTPGGVSQLLVNYNSTTKLWQQSNSKPISFGASSIVKTERNCSGGITPWGTSITSEESRNTGDANGDGYIDVGWQVEIDPISAAIKQYGNGIPEKLWAMGRMSHENVVVASDSRTAYYGEDSPDGCVYKFVATTAGNLSAGNLYVLKLGSALSSGEPTVSTGTWVQVPNTTKSDRNSTYSLAISLGGTQLNGVEDVEIAPDGKVYFTSKGNGRTYRFTDNGTSLSGFETYVGGRSYTVNYGTGSISESWGSGNDNLAFDQEGNLWVTQDGGRNHIWVVRNGHTQASPRVELFATTPAGGEPTGITFSPDNKFMFLSMQHPSSSNGSQVDAAGVSNAFNAAYTIVIARKENLGTGAGARIGTDFEGESYSSGAVNTTVFPNPSNGDFNLSLQLNETTEVNVTIYDAQGNIVKSVIKSKIFDAGSSTVQLGAMPNKGVYFVVTKVGDKSSVQRIIAN